MPDVDTTTSPPPMTVTVTYAVRIVSGSPSVPEIIAALASSLHLCAVDGASLVDLTATDAVLIE